jgi:hypothetical protein
MRRAIRRLSILEYVILVLAMAVAVAGGWIAAWLLQEALGLPFRPTWAVSSVLLFTVPGALHFRSQGLDSSRPSGDRGRNGSGTASDVHEHSTEKTDG